MATEDIFNRHLEYVNKKRMVVDAAIRYKYDVYIRSPFDPDNNDDSFQSKISVFATHMLYDPFCWSGNGNVKVCGLFASLLKANAGEYTEKLETIIRILENAEEYIIQKCLTLNIQETRNEIMAIYAPSAESIPESSKMLIENVVEKICSGISFEYGKYVDDIIYDSEYRGIYLPWGWTGHAVGVFVEAQGSVVNISLINSGQGIENHTKRGEKYEIYFTKQYSYDDAKKFLILMCLNYVGILSLPEDWKKMCISGNNAWIIEYYGKEIYDPLYKFMRERGKDDVKEYPPIFDDPQFSGSCTFYSVYYFFKVQALRLDQTGVLFDKVYGMMRESMMTKIEKFYTEQPYLTERDFNFIYPLWDEGLFFNDSVAKLAKYEIYSQKKLGEINQTSVYKDFIENQIPKLNLRESIESEIAHDILNAVTIMFESLNDYQLVQGRIAGDKSERHPYGMFLNLSSVAFYKKLVSYLKILYIGVRTDHTRYDLIYLFEFAKHIRKIMYSVSDTGRMYSPVDNYVVDILCFAIINTKIKNSNEDFLGGNYEEKRKIREKSSENGGSAENLATFKTNYERKIRYCGLSYGILETYNISDIHDEMIDINNEITKVYYPGYRFFCFRDVKIFITNPNGQIPYHEESFFPVWKNADNLDPDITSSITATFLNMMFTFIFPNRTKPMSYTLVKSGITEFLSLKWEGTQGYNRDLKKKSIYACSGSMERFRETIRQIACSDSHHILDKFFGKDISFLSTSFSSLVKSNYSLCDEEHESVSFSEISSGQYIAQVVDRVDSNMPGGVLSLAHKNNITVVKGPQTYYPNVNNSQKNYVKKEAKFFSENIFDLDGFVKNLRVNKATLNATIFIEMIFTDTLAMILSHPKKQEITSYLRSESTQDRKTSIVFLLLLRVFGQDSLDDISTFLLRLKMDDKLILNNENDSEFILPYLIVKLLPHEDVMYILNNIPQNAAYVAKRFKTASDIMELKKIDGKILTVCKPLPFISGTPISAHMIRFETKKPWYVCPEVISPELEEGFLFYYEDGDPKIRVLSSDKNNSYVVDNWRLYKVVDGSKYLFIKSEYAENFIKFHSQYSNISIPIRTWYNEEESTIIMDLVYDDIKYKKDVPYFKFVERGNKIVDTYFGNYLVEKPENISELYSKWASELPNCFIISDRQNHEDETSTSYKLLYLHISVPTDVNFLSLQRSVWFTVNDENPRDVCDLAVMDIFLKDSRYFIADINPNGLMVKFASPDDLNMYMASLVLKGKNSCIELLISQYTSLQNVLEEYFIKNFNTPFTPYFHSRTYSPVADNNYDPLNFNGRRKHYPKKYQKTVHEEIYWLRKMSTTIMNMAGEIEGMSRITELVNLELGTFTNANLVEKFKNFGQRYRGCKVDDVRVLAKTRNAISEYWHLRKTQYMENVDFLAASRFQKEYNANEFIIENYLLFYNVMGYVKFGEIIKAIDAACKVNDNDFLCSCGQVLDAIKKINTEIIYVGHRNPIIVLFEINFTNFITKSQYKIYQKIKNQWKTKELKVVQLLMGRGKTSVITPLIVMENIIKFRNVLVVLPTSLVRQTFSEYFCSEYPQLFLYYQLLNIKDRVEEVHNVESSVCVVDDTSLKLYKLDNLEYSPFVDNFFFIFDEYDSLYNPLTSNLNVPNTPHNFTTTELECIRKSVNLCIESFLTNKTPVHDLGSNFTASMISAKNMNYKHQYGFGNRGEGSASDYFLAIPYSALNAPSHGSKFTDTYLTIILSVFSYMHFYYSDLFEDRPEDIDQFVEFFGSKSQSYRTYDNIYHEILEIIGTSTILDIRTSIKPVHFRNKKVMSFFLEEIIFRKYLKLSKTQNNCNFLDISRKNFAVHKTGFSGTVNVKMIGSNSGEFSENVDSSGADSEEIECAVKGILNPCDINLVNLDEESEHGPLDQIMNVIREFNNRANGRIINCVIDAGAFFKKYNPKQLIEIFVKKFKQRKEYEKYVYINDKDEFVSTTDGENFEISKKSKPENNIFLYYDNKHTVGTDYRQPYYFTGICTVGIHNTYTQISQAIYRMRQLNYGHEIHYLVDGSTQCKSPQDLYDFLNRKEEASTEGSLGFLYMQHISYTKKITSCDNYNMEVFNPFGNETFTEFVRRNYIDGVEIEEARLLLRLIDKISNSGQEQEKDQEKDQEADKKRANEKGGNLFMGKLRGKIFSPPFQYEAKDYLDLQKLTKIFGPEEDKKGLYMTPGLMYMVLTGFCTYCANSNIDGEDKVADQDLFVSFPISPDFFFGEECTTNDTEQFKRFINIYYYELESCLVMISYEESRSLMVNNRIQPISIKKISENTVPESVLGTAVLIAACRNISPERLVGFLTYCKKNIYSCSLLIRLVLNLNHHVFDIWNCCVRYDGLLFCAPDEERGIKIYVGDERINKAIEIEHKKFASI